MIINATPHDLSVKRLNIAALILLLCLAGALLSIFWKPQAVNEEMWVPPPPVKADVKRLDILDFHLFDTKLNLPLPKFTQKVKIHQVNTRPDASNQQTIRINVGEQEFALKVGQKIQLTPLVSAVAKLQNGALDLFVSVDVGDLEKKSRFHFDDLSIHETIAAASLLKKAEVIGPDLLISRYGGKAYAAKKGKLRLFFSGGERLFVGPNDLFFFENEKWQAGQKAKCPLARVESVTGNSIELKVWNEAGTSFEKVRLSVKSPEPMMARPEQIFTQVRKRTSSKASLKVGNRQMIIKKGDWLIKSKHGFQAIQTGKELQALLDDQSAEELFVFDGWVDGCFKGTLFSSSRTSAADVKLPLMGKKL